MMCKTRWSNILAVIFGLGLANGYAVESMVGNSNSVENTESKTIVVQDAKAPSKEIPNQVSSVEVASQRIIVKFKLSDKQKEQLNNAKNNLSGQATKAAKLKASMQVKEIQSQPLAKDVMVALAKVAGVSLVDISAYVDGGRILLLKDANGKLLTQQDIESVIAKMKIIPNILAVEQDGLMKPQEDYGARINTQKSTNQWSLFTKPIHYTYTKGVDIVPPIFYGTTWVYTGAGFYDESSNQFVDSTGEGVVIAVLDTSYVPHPDFISNLIQNDENDGYGYRFLNCYAAGECSQAEQGDTKAYPDALAVLNSHGTQATGIMVGQGISSNAMLGGAPDAKVVPVRVSADTVGGSFSDAIAGMYWAAGLHPEIPNSNPAQILNLSLGGRGECSGAMQEAIDNIVDQNISLVVSAGNNGIDVAFFNPSGCKGVISVAAYIGSEAAQPLPKLADFTNTGSVTIVAPSGCYATNIMLHPRGVCDIYFAPVLRHLY
jgi:hypothetical protein